MFCKYVLLCFYAKDKQIDDDDDDDDDDDEDK